METKGNILLENITIKNYTYESDGYYIFKGYKRKEKFTFCSNERVIVGVKYNIKAEKTIHKKYGEQYKVLEATISKELSEEDIKNCLKSYKNIGPAMANKIYDKYGQDSLEKVEESVNNLIYAGMSEKKALEAFESIQEDKYLKVLRQELAPFNISIAVQKKLYDIYGTSTLNILNKNPYDAIDEVYGYTFEIADTFAITRGIVKENSALRIKYAMQHVLDTVGYEGHTYLPAKDLITYTYKYLSNRSKNISSLKLMDIKKILVYLNREKSLEKKDIIIENDSATYSKKFYFAERRSAKNILNLLKAKSNFKLNKSFSELIEEVEKEIGITYSDNQREAQETSITNNVSIITGGPGTGKTTTVNGLIKVIKKIDKNVKLMLVAPTGRAAQRMAETTGEKASTIHRMLEYKQIDGVLKSSRDTSNPIDCDVLIIDEASMVDILLFDEFLKAIKLGTKIIILGDVDQLPSVGPGNVLRDLISSNVIPTTRLNTIFRQAGTSMIVVNANKINNGESIDCTSDDFKFIKESNQVKVAQMIVDRFVELYESGTTLDELQVLSPYKRKTECGSNALNKEIQSRINPYDKLKPEVKVKGISFRLNDKVMQMKNNIEKGCFNGDVGYITSVNPKNLEIVVKFDEERIITFSGKEEVEELELAYACSIHKSQGSEYKTVLIPLVMEHKPMLTRNLFYTGVTRAKKEVELYGMQEAVNLSISNKQTKKRYSKLQHRVRTNFVAA